MKIKKVLIFSLIFIALIIFGNIKVFATFTFEYNNNSYNVTNLPQVTKEYQVLSLQYDLKNSRYVCRFLCSDYPIGIYNNSDSWGYGIKNPGNGELYGMTGNASVWGSSSSVESGTFYSVSETRYQTPVFWSNHELRLYSSSNDIKYYYDTASYSILVDEPIPPEHYNNYPYFLNSQEDIAQGDKDLIIMPRRFSKRQGYLFCFARG